MLTEDQINQNKVRYIELLTHLNIDLTKLTKYLDMERVDFFRKPFTSNNEVFFPDIEKTGDFKVVKCVGSDPLE